MKKNKILLNIVLVLIVCIILIPCLFVFGSKMNDSAREKVDIYYLSTLNHTLIPMKTKLPDKENESELISYTLESMQIPVQKDGIRCAFPRNVEILSAELKGDTVLLNLSQNYYKLGNAEEVISRSALVWTLTSLDFVNAIELQIEGKPLKNGNGQKVGVMNRNTLILEPEISPEITEYAIVQLYFTNKDGSDFVVEDRVVEVTANQPREKAILEQLISGPKEEGAYATIPIDTKIRELTTTADGICYVNLSQEFVSKPSNLNEALTIYSIVNSLCELEEVDKVQFLIEGEKMEVYKGRKDFGTPFTAIKNIETVVKREEP